MKETDKGSSWGVYVTKGPETNSRSEAGLSGLDDHGGKPNGRKERRGAHVLLRQRGDSG